MFNKKFFLHIILFLILFAAIYFGGKWGHSTLQHLKFLSFFLAGIGFCGIISFLKKQKEVRMKQGKIREDEEGDMVKADSGIIDFCDGEYLTSGKLYTIIRMVYKSGDEFFTIKCDDGKERDFLPDAFENITIRRELEKQRKT
jgi:hypothetical protein